MPAPDLTRIAGTLTERSFPKIFAVELCADCNLACTMCHHPQMRRPKGKMPFELWKRCADQIAVIAPDTDVWFSFCGEPLLDPDRLMLFVEYGHMVGLRSLNLNTNGMLLAPDVAERIARSPLRMAVIGIDGFSPGVYERIRVNGVRDEVYGNVENLLRARQARKHGPEVMVQFIEMDENAHELEAFKEHWLARGATAKVRNKLSWGGKLGTPLEIPIADRIPCPWAVTMMHVFWDGRVPRCPGDTEGEEGAGNAWEEPLDVLWGRLGQYRDKHLGYRFGELPARCSTCKDWMVGAAVRLRPSRLPVVG